MDSKKYTANADGYKIEYITDDYATYRYVKSVIETVENPITPYLSGDEVICPTCKNTMKIKSDVKYLVCTRCGQQLVDVDSAINVEELLEDDDEENIYE